MKMPDPTELCDKLTGAVITHLGTHMEVMFRDRSHEANALKIAVSTQSTVPVEFVFKIKGHCQREWWIGGLNVNPTDGPAIIRDNASEHFILYTNEQGRFRHKILNKHGTEYSEEYADEEGNLHRIDGPARILIKHGSPSTQTYAQYCADLEPIVSGYMKGDHVVNVLKDRHIEWYEHGELREGTAKQWSQQFDYTIAERTEFSSMMIATRTTVVAQRVLRWYNKEQKLHRTDGPAMLTLNNVKEISRDCREAKWKVGSWRGEWYVNGQEIPALTLHQWLKKNSFMLHDLPCHDCSAFVTEEAEVCFLTDFC